MISRIIKVKVSVILRSRKLRWITQTENCFNTVLLYIQKLERKQLELLRAF